MTHPHDTRHAVPLSASATARLSATPSGPSPAAAGATVTVPGGGASGAAGGLGRAAEGDVRFVLDLAVRLRWDARTHDPDGSSARSAAQLGAGTLDALLWVMGLTDFSPASGEDRRNRSVRGLMLEAALAASLRKMCPLDSPHRVYLGGVADALDFAAGQQRPFWWVGIPEQMRPGRDQYGRDLT